MLRLKRHIVTEISGIFLAVVIALILIMISFQFAKLLSEAASGKIVGSAIFKLISLQLVGLFILLSPFAFFIAILITLNKLANTNELIAMRSIGYSDVNIYQSLFTAAIPLSAIVLFLSLIVEPKTIELSYRLEEKAEKESELSIMQPGSFRNIGSNMTIFVAEASNKQFSKFFIWQRKDDTESVTVATSGNQIESDGKRYIELKNGSRYGWSEKSSYLMLFANFIGLLPDIENISYANKIKSLPTKTLLAKPELPYKVELQKRITPVISILLLTLCTPLLIQFNPRENKYGKFIIAIFIYAIYINTQYIAKVFTSNGKIPLFPGMYAVHIIFLVILLCWIIGKYHKQIFNLRYSRG